MQLPEKYKQNFDVSSEGPSSGLAISIMVISILDSSIMVVSKLFSLEAQ
jgi:hypothetical protein